jgi:hypothetical protein
LLPLHSIVTGDWLRVMNSFQTLCTRQIGEERAIGALCLNEAYCTI